MIQHILVAVVAMGMALAFWSADRRSRTSGALALALASMGVAIVAQTLLFHPDWQSTLRPWAGWLAIPETVAIIAELEWLLRVRRTVPAAPGLNTAYADGLLRRGQFAALVYLAFALIWPETRLTDFLQAAENHGWAFLLLPGFWLYALPILFCTLTGLVAILLLMRRRPDPAELIRVFAMAAATPFFMAGFVLGHDVAVITTVIGEMIFLVGAVHYHVLQGQRGQFMSRFLSPQVAQLVAQRGLDRAMQENLLEISVVSCDLRGFTAYAEAGDSSRVLSVLREYYDEVGTVVARFGGTIKDYAGDGILILVGAPVPVEHHARCALEMARRIREIGIHLTARWSLPGHPLGIGIGVATGEVTVGVIGSATRLEYTAVGATVNLACRLCAEAHHGEILIDQRTVALAGEAGLEARVPVPVKGIREPVPHFALVLSAPLAA